MVVKAEAAMPKPEFIVLDSNVIIADYWLRSSSFMLLRAYLKKAGKSLVMPQIVFEEVINHRGEELSQAKLEIRDTQRKLSRLFRSAEPTFKRFFEIAKKERDDPYEGFLADELNKMGAEILDYKDIPHKAIVARDLKRARPFQQSGKGYRDALLWETVLRGCTQKGSSIVFITDNVADFYDKHGSLHDDLKVDVRDKGIAEADFQLFRNLVEFTDKLVVPFLKARKDFVTLVQNDKVDGLSLRSVCDDNINTIIDAINDAPDSMIGEPEICEPSVDEVYIPAEFDITGASEISLNRLLVAFKFRATVAFLWFLDRSDYVTMSEEVTSGIHVVEPDWNESVMQVESSCEIDLKCRLTFDVEEKAVESFEVESVEGVWNS